MKGPLRRSLSYLSDYLESRLPLSFFGDIVQVIPQILPPRK